MAPRADSQQRDSVASARQALREVNVALGASAALVAIMVAAVLVADREAVAAIGALGLAASLALGAVVARRTRRISLARNTMLAEERESRERLDRTLAATRRFLETESPVDLRRQICAIAREVFDCSAASLWSVEGEEVALLERVPWGPPYTASVRRPIRELPGLRDALDAGRPLFVADLREGALGATQATAEVVGGGSLLDVPIAVGGVTRLMLGLLWDEVRPEPGGAQRVAYQRYADQAGLALEQARNRTAQAEIASLNRTLSAMVQTDPLFRADGTEAEVAEAVCAKAVEVFEASGAALWTEHDDGIVLVRRVPHAAIFGRRMRIAFAEHPSFRADLESGQARFIADVEHDDPVLWERFARSSGSRSQLRLPLASAGEARALIVLSWDHPVEPPSREVSAIASRFADQAAVALAEAARRSAQREVGELHARFERGLLPTIALDAPGAEVATFYRPGDERLSLGGDFYDCLQLPDGGIALLVGDVAGHGVAAAALGAGLRSAWRALVLGGWELEQLHAGLQAVCVRERHDPHIFVTALSAVVAADRTSMRHVSAGHPPPMILGGAAAGFDTNGPPIGVVAHAEWPVVEVALPPVVSILLHTDGLVEGRAAPDTPDRLGVAPIQRELDRIAPGAVGEDELRRLVALATAANGRGLPDDVALLALNLRAG